MQYSHNLINQLIHQPKDKEDKLDACRQGSIDELCGIYAVLNGIRLVLPPKRFHSSLLSLCATALLEKRGSVYFINDGTDITDIAYLLKNVICLKFAIERSKPFHTKPQTSLDTYWNGIVDFLKEKNRAVILLFHTIYMGHWTVVKEADESRLYLFDSKGIRDLKREDCLMDLPTEARHRQLFPTRTYFLKPLY